MHLILLVLHQQIAILPPLLARGDATYLLLHGHVEEHLLLLIKFVLLRVCRIHCFIELGQVARVRGIGRIGSGVQVTRRRVQPPVIILEVFVVPALYSLSSLISRSLSLTCWLCQTLLALIHTLARTALNPTLHLL